MLFEKAKTNAAHSIGQQVLILILMEYALWDELKYAEVSKDGGS